ncbi:MAG: large subunit ribosomal protein [Patescibacteria group bacterium]|nr:50S ribosomal protein L4 [Candidatus Saccharibacteria bacterium]MDQ5963427.1 large subunit ribosomal protein [Patescibacteria group bacterium]
MATPTFTASGTKATTAAKLSNDVFGVEVKSHQLVKQAYETYLANGRDNLAVTKTRGLVRGGGKKPWKQKGTGRARFGSTRNPIWRGGGIVFGPTGLENYTKKLPVASKHVALRQALTLANEGNKIVVIEKLASKEGKTAEMVKLLEKLGAVRNTLIVVADKTDELKRATANIQTAKLVSAKYVNVYDIMNAHHIIVTSDALAAVEEWLAPSAKATTKEAK